MKIDPYLAIGLCSPCSIQLWALSAELNLRLNQEINCVHFFGASPLRFDPPPPGRISKLIRPPSP